MRLPTIALLLTSLVGLACTRAPASSPTSVPPAAPAAPAATTATAGPHFMEDDFAGAVAVARAAGKVVFVDAWAPWCHTCLSMQQEVLSQPALASYADRVVFVAVDTDRPEAAAFLEAFTVKLWPTFFMIADDGVRQLGVHPGSMDLDETKRFLDDGIRLAKAAVVDGPERQLLDAHAAFAKGDIVAAVAGYEAASSTSWPRRTEAILGGMRALSSRQQSRDDHFAGCVRFGTAHLGDVITGGAPGDLAAGLLSCAERCGDAALLRTTQQLVHDRLIELSTTPAAGSAVDDQADILATLAGLQDRSGAEGAVAAKQTHERRLALLEAAAAAATSPKQAQVHDYARLNSLLALDRGDDAIALFQRRVKDLPDNYEPWARLGSVLHRLKRADEAQPAIEQAIRLSYGTRRLRYRQLAADNAKLQGDVAAERAALQALVQEASLLPAVLNDEALASAARTRLAALPQTP